MTSSTNSGWPPARARTKRRSSSGARLDPEAKRDEALDVPAARGRRDRSRRGCRPSRAGARTRRAPRRRTRARACLQRCAAPPRGARSCPRPWRARRPTRRCAGGPRRGSAPCARTPAGGAPSRLRAGRRRARAERREHGADLFGLQPERAEARLHGQDALARESPSLVPQSTCSMQTIPESGNSLPRGGHVAMWKPTL